MPAELVKHPLAVCCWCGGGFLKWGPHWVCGTGACQEKQWRHVVVAPARTSGAGTILNLPTPKQIDFELCPARNMLGGGAAGGSKSHGLRWNLYRKAMRIPGFQAVILRRTYPELEKTHLRDMMKDAPRLGATFVETKRQMRFPETGALVEAGHCDTEQDVQKWLSTEYDEIDIDEGSTFQGDWLIELATRARTTKPEVLADGGAKFRVFSNPGGVGALHLMDFYIDQSPDPDRFRYYRPQDYAFILSRLEDNPYLDQDYADRLNQLPDARRRQLRDGDWRVHDGQFFSSWDESKHVVELGEINADIRRFCGLDWGYNAPGCCVWVACLPDGHFHVEREYKFNGPSGDKVTVKEVAATIKRISNEIGLKKTPITLADPDLTNHRGQIGETILQTFQKWGIPMEASDNQRNHGWQRIQELLRTAPDGTPWLTVDPGCRYLRRTFPAAVMDKNDPEDLDTISDDHGLDAVRYWAMGWPVARDVRTMRKHEAGTFGAWKAELDDPKQGRLHVRR